MSRRGCRGSTGHPSPAITRLGAGLALALTVSACGPSLSILLRDGRYPEAICKANHSGDGDIRAAAPDLSTLGRPRWRLRRIVPEDLPGLDAGLASSLFGSYVLFKIETQVDSVTGLILTYGPTPVGGRDLVSLWSVDELALAFTDEVVPGVHDEEVDVRKPGDKDALLWAMATLGLSLAVKPLWTTEQTTEKVGPTPAEVARAAPRAVALATVLHAIAGFPYHGDWYALPKKPGDTVVRFEPSLTVDSDTRECGKRVILHFAPVEVPLVDEQPWPAGAAFRPLEWEAVEVPQRAVITKAGVAHGWIDDQSLPIR